MRVVIYARVSTKTKVAIFNSATCGTIAPPVDCSFCASTLTLANQALRIRVRG
jgi:hypothetical protein